MEFARAKAIYEEFVNNFGKIQFPIGSPIDSFDMAFKNDLEMKFKGFINPIPYTPEIKSKMSIVVRNSRTSKFMMQRQPIKSVQSEDMQNSVMNSSVTDIPLLKERLQSFLYKSTLLFYSNIFDMSIQR